MFLYTLECISQTGLVVQQTKQTEPKIGTPSNWKKKILIDENFRY